MLFLPVIQQITADVQSVCPKSFIFSPSVSLSINLSCHPQSVTMTSWRLSVHLSLWVVLRWLLWLWSSSSWPSTSSSAMEICGSSSGWSCSGRCSPGTSASSSSSSCPLMSARYETTACCFFCLHCHSLIIIICLHRVIHGVCFAWRFALLLDHLQAVCSWQCKPAYSCNSSKKL